ncbi:heme-binding protein [Flavobacterium sp.]|uniref:SOUL family heme-binding protein n=1 Tax=Flavobacterium sp. TaxID=239 RepID=UPI00286EA2E7|nr:heme-binding protein [Flavobacterium sp.]
MKIFIVIISIVVGLFLLFQIYTVMSINKTETQAYKLIQKEKNFEIRYYPAATMAMITSSSKSYRDLGSSGFGKLAKYIFGGNNEKKQIAMTSPVHMDIGETNSTMAFVLPAVYNQNTLPKPNDSSIDIITSEPEYVAVIQFGGFANNERIDEHKTRLENNLIDKGISFYGNFRYLGYNPPYQLLGRRNEVIVALHENNFSEK